jgi:pyruvate kinase
LEPPGDNVNIVHGEMSIVSRKIFSRQQKILSSFRYFNATAAVRTTSNIYYIKKTTLKDLATEEPLSKTSAGGLTKLICTVGPSTHSPELIQQLVDHGMRVMRINCEQSTKKEMLERVQWLRLCQGLHGCYQKDPKRPPNLRSVMFDTSTEEHLKLAIEMDVDFVSIPFVNHSNDVEKIKQKLLHFQQEFVDGTNSSTSNILSSTNVPTIPKIIAKIQTSEALMNFNEILHVSDGIMVGRSNLAKDIPMGVVRAQKKIIKNCNVSGKPVIIASQMLDSMIDHTTPTRAEVSDIVNAVYDGADCVMLSMESSHGKYPIESCSILSSIARQADMSYSEHTSNHRHHHHHHEEREDDHGYRGVGNGVGNVTSFRNDNGSDNGIKNDDYFSRGVWPAMTKAAVQQASYGKVDLIVVITSSGKTAEMLSAEKGQVPIMAYVDNAKVGRQLSCHRGIWPVYGPIKNVMWTKKKKFETNDSLRISKEKMDMLQHELFMIRPKEAVIKAKELNLIQEGDTVLIVMSEPSSNVLGRTLTTRTARVK